VGEGASRPRYTGADGGEQKTGTTAGFTAANKQLGKQGNKVLFYRYFPIGISHRQKWRRMAVDFPGRKI
jgi:hypothetical protein